MFHIGPYLIEVPVVLAPMAGITDYPFRQMCRKFGVGMTLGEMQSAAPQLRHTEKSRLRGVRENEPLPRGIQIVGNDPKHMADFARYSVDQGAGLIDINMGCPAKKVCRKQAGSALLGNERLVAQILDAVVNAVSVPVSLKIRTGLDPDHRNGVRIAKIAETAGIQALSVHGRTRACKFGGHAEYETIKAIKQAVKIPIIANGDIDSAAKAKVIMATTGADAVMVGRAAFGAPWLFAEIGNALTGQAAVKTPTVLDQCDIVLEHLELIWAHYGEMVGSRVARKHIKWYTRSFHEQAYLMKCLSGTLSPNVIRATVSDFYQEISNPLSRTIDSSGIIASCRNVAA